jgi:hypothetical protein
MTPTQTPSPRKGEAPPAAAFVGRDRHDGQPAERADHLKG